MITLALIAALVVGTPPPVEPLPTVEPVARTSTTVVLSTFSGTVTPTAAESARSLRIKLDACNEKLTRTTSTAESLVRDLDRATVRPSDSITVGEWIGYGIVIVGAFVGGYYLRTRTEGE